MKIDCDFCGDTSDVTTIQQLDAWDEQHHHDDTWTRSDR